MNKNHARSACRRPSSRIWAGVLFLAGSIFVPAHAQTGASPDYDSPLGIALEEYPYPHPVQFLRLSVQGQAVRMAYMDIYRRPNGAGSARPDSAVLLLHGKNFYGSYWESTIKALAASGRRVIVPDQIGFGKSSKPAINYSFDLLAENTSQLLRNLGIKKVDVVGHSMGGMLAVRFARAYPDRVGKLVLENPIGLEDYRLKVPPQSIEKYYQTEINNTDTAKMRAFLQRYVVQWEPSKYERFVAVRKRVTLSGEYPRWAQSAALTSQMIYQQPVRHEFSLIKAPTLLIIGQEDRTTIGRDQVSPETAKTLGQYPQLGREAARDIPGAKLVELQGVGHIPHLEVPERFHSILVDFLQKGR